MFGHKVERRLSLRIPSGESSALLSLGLLYVCVAVGAQVFLGNRLGEDSPRYFKGAEQWLAGEALPSISRSYISYILTVALAYKLSAFPLTLVYLIQWLVYFLAGVGLYKELARRMGSTAAYVVAFIFLLNPMMWVWNLYILTETLYFSSLLVAVLLCIRLRRVTNWINFLSCAFVITYASHVRPTGLVVPCVVALWALVLFLRIESKHKFFFLALTALCGIDLLSIYLVQERVLSAHVSTAEFRQSGMIVWNYSGITFPLPHSWHGPLALLHGLTLGGVRITVEMFQVRPFFSLAHNAYSLISLTAVYWLALRGGRRWFQSLFSGVGSRWGFEDGALIFFIDCGPSPTDRMVWFRLGWTFPSPVLPANLTVRC